MIRRIISGAAAAVAGVLACVLVPAILGLLIESVLSTFGIFRTGLALIIASLTSGLLHVSPGHLLVAWIVATTIGALIGGFVGAFLGSLGAAFVLQRHRLEA